MDSRENNVRELYDEVKRGGYQLGRNENLQVVNRLMTMDTRELPFGQMLVWVNEVHRDGIVKRGHNPDRHACNDGTKDRVTMHSHIV